MTEEIHVKITLDVAEIREWADKHADAGNHSVAHVLYAALAAADLIAPDLPKADKDGWWWPQHPAVGNVHRTSLHGDRSIVLQGFGGREFFFTPEEADGLADILKAAARAEQVKTDD